VNGFVLGMTEYYAEEYQNVACMRRRKASMSLRAKERPELEMRNSPSVLERVLSPPKECAFGQKINGSIPVKLMWAHAAVE